MLRIRIEKWRWLVSGAALLSLVATVWIANQHAGGSAAMEKQSSSRGLLPQGPPVTSGRPFQTSTEASAAFGGMYVPECPGAKIIYAQANGPLVVLFKNSDLQLWVYPASTGFTPHPIPSNDVVTPRTLTAQGQVAYGYEAVPGIVDAPATATNGLTREGALVHSYLTWSNRHIALALVSPAELSLSELTDVANSCA